tara:strand:- start:1567 stop:2622 length:1056 start_codon:yes stop_codon:yes gene_type:complete
MKLIFKDFKKGKVKIETDSLDDLWFLSHIIEPSDLISGKTVRKIKVGDATEKVKIIKKTATLKINVEKVEFHKFSSHLRISGKIVEAPDDIPKGSFHTFDVEDSSKITIEKSQWLKYQIEKLNEATQEKMSKVLVLALDRDEATFALLTTSGYKILLETKGDVAKKEFDTKGKDFFAEMVKVLQDYVKKYKIEQIIVASPAFWKEDFMKKLNKDQLPKITLATCNSDGRNAIEEVLRRTEVKAVLKQDRSAKESLLVEELLAEISKDGASAYGMKEVDTAAQAGAIKVLLVSEDLIQKTKQDGGFDDLNNIMKLVDNTKGDVHIIASDHDMGKQLKGLGGIGAILRYKLEY